MGLLQETSPSRSSSLLRFRRSRMRRRNPTVGLGLSRKVRHCSILSHPIPTAHLPADEDYISFLESLQEVSTKPFDLDTLETLSKSRKSLTPPSPHSTCLRSCLHPTRTPPNYNSSTRSTQSREVRYQRQRSHHPQSRPLQRSRRPRPQEGRRQEERLCRCEGEGN